MSKLAIARRAFRRLHEYGCFVIPNPWDVGTARYLRHLGFGALATTSSGFAFTRGLPDTDGALPLSAALAHIREIVAATELPASADFESGHARTAEALARNVTACIATGVAGLSIEDASGDKRAPLLEIGLAVERIRVAQGGHRPIGRRRAADCASRLSSGRPSAFRSKSPCDTCKPTQRRALTSCLRPVCAIATRSKRSWRASRPSRSTY
jgi:hypothetical protein